MAFHQTLLSQALLYKFRYVVGYGFLLGLLLLIVSVDIDQVPSGLSTFEMQQAVTSTSLRFSLDFSWVINAPYNFIQNLSVTAFGLSRLALVLPSLLFGAVTILLFSLTMRHWFRDIVAVVTTAIAVTTALFMTMLRSATPDIMLPFWSILLLYAAMRLLIKREKAFVWKLLIVFASLSLLYTPYGIYPLVAVFGSAIFHPHVRSRLRHIPQVRLVILSLITLVGLGPLAIYLWHSPGSAADLIGLETIRQSVYHLKDNLLVVYDLYLNVFKNGFSVTQVIPVFNIASIALMLLGLFRSIQTRYTARSYVLLSLSGATLVTMLLLPEVTALVFIPSLLLLAIGTETLVAEWYSLFPRNPYARLAGLIPLTILFLGIVTGNVSHYFNNHNHMTNPFFSQSLPAVQQALVVEGNHQVFLVTPARDEAFYKILNKEYPLLKVVTTPPPLTDTPTFVMPSTPTPYQIAPSRIVTSSLTHEAVLLRIYRPQ